MVVQGESKVSGARKRCTSDSEGQNCKRKKSRPSQASPFRPIPNKANKERFSVTEVELSSNSNDDSVYTHDTIPKSAVRDQNTGEWSSSDTTDDFKSLSHAKLMDNSLRKDTLVGVLNSCEASASGSDFEDRVLNYLRKRAVQITSPHTLRFNPLSEGRRFNGHNSQLPRSTSTFCETIMDNSLEITVTNEHLCVDSWITTHVWSSIEKAGDVRHLARVGSTKFNLGLDLEWKPNRWAGSDNKVALLQLSVGSHALLIQMLFLDSTPSELVDLLLSKNVRLGGVGITEDLSKLSRDHGLRCSNAVVELTAMASQKLELPHLKKVGLKKLAEHVLGQSFTKCKRVTMSDWAKRELSAQQVAYAATDAWVSHAILQKLDRL